MSSRGTRRSLNMASTSASRLFSALLTQWVFSLVTGGMDSAPSTYGFVDFRLRTLHETGGTSITMSPSLSYFSSAPLAHAHISLEDCTMYVVYGSLVALEALAEAFFSSGLDSSLMIILVDTISLRQFLAI